MVTQQRELDRRLEPNGWRRLDEEPWIDAWWADEVWVLESLWAPQDCRVYLTFVVDPGWEGDLGNGRGVHAVTAALEKPAKISDVMLYLGRGWADHLDTFFAGLSGLRLEWGGQSGEVN